MIPKGNNSLGALSIFKQREIYEEMFPEIITNAIDLWKPQQNLYGRVDYEGYSVIPKSRKLVLASRDKNVFALDFVQQSFIQLQLYVNQQITTKVISPEDGFLSDISPKKGWNNLEEIYEKQIDAIYSVFSNVYLRKDKKYLQLTTFGTFIPLFIGFLQEALGEVPITKNTIVKSKFSNPDNSGLTIQIAQENQGDDETKYQTYIKDPNFDWWCKASKKFGFLVDKNAPWRLIYDITSPYSQIIYENLGIKPETVFKSHYDRVFLNDFEAFQRNVLRFYNVYVGNNPIVKLPYYCEKTSKTKVRDFARQTKTRQEISSIYPDFWWFRLYFGCMCYEQKIDVSQNTFESIINGAKFFWKRNQKEEAFLFADKKLSSLRSGSISVSIVF